MLVVIVRHLVRPGQYDAAKARVAGTTDRIMRQPGVLFRHSGDSNGSEIVTLTAWRSREDREAWDAARKASPPPGALTDFYSGVETQEVEVFDARSAEADLPVRLAGAAR